MGAHIRRTYFTPPTQYLFLLHTGERFNDAVITEMGPHIAHLFYYSDTVPILLPTGERFYDAVLTEKGLEECHRLKASKIKVVK